MITDEFSWKIALSVIVAVAAIIDFRTFTISNKFPMVIAGLFVVYWAVSGFSLAMLGASLLSGVAAFIVALALYIFRVMGGGDVKLLTALALWFAPMYLLPFFFWIAISGGVIGAVYLAYHALNKRSPKSGEGPGDDGAVDVAKPALKQRVPYGPAIAFGFIMTWVIAAV